MSLLQRILSPIVEVRKEETAGVALMFLYSFLAMTGYNVLKPVTRSKFISTLGADNLPYVLLASAFVIGVLMHWYTTAAARIPRQRTEPALSLGIMLTIWSHLSELASGADA